jgi:hypothetical protein
MKLPRAVFVIMGNMQDGLPKPQDLCRGEDGNVLRICERPILFCSSVFHPGVERSAMDGTHSSLQSRTMFATMAKESQKYARITSQKYALFSPR